MSDLSVKNTATYVPKRADKAAVRANDSLKQTVETAGRSITAAQDALKALQATPIVNGILTNKLTLPATSSNITVQHNLGHKPYGWIVVWYDGVMPEMAFSAYTTSSLTLTRSDSGSSTKFRLWVF